MNEKLKILVVDDDRRMVKTICDILMVKGYEAMPVYSGEEAVEAIRSKANPDCVFMDLKMSGMDGVAALAMIKEVAADLPVVLMSAYATEEQVAEAKRQGAYTVLIQQVLSFLVLLRKEESVLVVDDDPAFGQDDEGYSASAGLPGGDGSRPGEGPRTYGENLPAGRYPRSQTRQC